jgi:Raf kinase inhibitor-like YbhB/YbcL family protein
MPFTITSSAFTPGQEIAPVYTCEGADHAPPLTFSDVPPSAKSLALIVEDPDAPDPKKPERIFVHWVLYDLPASSPGLPEGARAQNLPAGAREGQNGWNRQGYGGPCPPVGRHRYFFKAYALDTLLGDRGALTKQQLLDAMQGHVVAEAELVGTYQRRGGLRDRIKRALHLSD